MAAIVTGAAVALGAVAASTKPMTLWRKIETGTYRNVYSRGIHEANDLVAEKAILSLVPPALYVAASTKPMTLWRSFGVVVPFDLGSRGIHEANDLVADRRNLKTSSSDAMSRHPRSQ